MSGSGVGVLACERARDPGIDWPSDSRLPAAAVRPTERPAALRNERRSSVEDWRIASLVSRMAKSIRYYRSLGIDCTIKPSLGNNHRSWGYTSGPSSAGNTLPSSIHDHAARRNALPRGWFRPLTQPYGPVVRCNLNLKNGGGWSCASVSGPCMERLCSWPSWISARTRSHSRKGPERPLGSPDHGYDGETVSPFPPSNSQTSAGISCARDQPWTSPRRVRTR